MADKLLNIPPDDGGTTEDVQATFDSFVHGGLNANFTEVGPAALLPVFALESPEQYNAPSALGTRSLA
jgi:hypothetical protein